LKEKILAMKTETQTQVRSFIEDNFLFREDRSALSDTESLLEAGLIDSTGILELVAFLEERFKIDIADADLIPANFDSIEAIVAYVERVRAIAPSTS
jgi:acyl carrier protein